MWDAAFSSKSVLKKSSPLEAMGDEWGTSATSPSRPAPSSVSISFCSTSWPRVACASTMRPFSKRTWMPSIMVPWYDSGLVAVTVPSARSLCGVVKISSVGMLGMQ